MRGKGGRGKEVEIRVQNGDIDCRLFAGLSVDRRLPRRRGRRNVSQVGITTVAGKREENRVMILIGSEREREGEICGELVKRVDIGT